MASVNFQAPTEYSAEAEDIARRRKYAELLQAQSIEPLVAQPTAPGGFAVPISWTQGAAKLFDAYNSKNDLARAKADEKALGDRYKNDQARILREAFSAGSGTPATPELPANEMDAAGTPAAPAVAPDMTRMAMLLQQSANPAHQAFGMQTMQEEMHRKRLAALLGGQGGAVAAPQPQAAVGAPAAPMGGIAGPPAGGQPLPVQQPRPSGGIPAGIDPLAWKLAVDTGDQKAISAMIQKAYEEENKPTDMQRNFKAAGIPINSPEARRLLTDPSARLAAQEATMVDFTIPGTDKKVRLPNSIANVLATGTAPDNKTADIAASVAQSLGMNVNIGVGVPGGLTGGAMPLGESEKGGMEEAAKGSVKHIATDLNDSLMAAQNAQKRHTTLQQIHSAVASGKAITGPGATPATWFQRVGETMFGPGNKKSVVETQQLVQGLADLALSGASAMRGQGAITENERLLLMKAKSGVQNLLPDELNTLLTIFDKQNRFEIGQHNDRYSRAEKIKYPNLEYWGKVDEPPKLGAPKAGVSLSPEAIKFMQDNNIPVPGR